MFRAHTGSDSSKITMGLLIFISTMHTFNWATPLYKYIGSIVFVPLNRFESELISDEFNFMICYFIKLLILAFVVAVSHFVHLGHYIFWLRLSRDYRQVTNSDWDRRSAKTWRIFSFGLNDRSAISWDQCSDWAIAESKVNLNSPVDAACTRS